MGGSIIYMKHNVPFYSQYDDVTQSEWRSRSCTIVCMKMALEYLTELEIPSADKLIAEGLYIGAHTPDGWSHHKTALLAHNYGAPAYLEEFRSVYIDAEGQRAQASTHEIGMRDFGIEKIASAIKAGNLVIVSALRNLDVNGTFHTILITGVEEKEGRVLGFYFHDPDTTTERRVNSFIELPDFLLIWRKMAIFIGKNRL